MKIHFDDNIPVAVLSLSYLLQVLIERVYLPF